jgi:hypothetical protein
MSKHTDINVHEDARIKLSVRGIWAIVVAVCISSVWATTFQLTMNNKIERLYLSNQIQHETILQKISELNTQQALYALKRQVEDVSVFMTAQLNDQLGITNGVISDELKLRDALRKILQ